MTEEPTKVKQRRARRRENGMAKTAGVSKRPAPERFTNSLALLRAALKVWETKHASLQTRSVWNRTAGCEAE